MAKPRTHQFVNILLAPSGNPHVDAAIASGVELAALCADTIENTREGDPGAAAMIEIAGRSLKALYSNPIFDKPQ